MMYILVPEEYRNRTEYQLLSKWYELGYVSIDRLLEASQYSKMVLVGRILAELNNSELRVLEEWTFLEGNQLICIPAWKEVNIADIFDLEIIVKIKNKNLTYEKWKISEIKYFIVSNINEGIIHQNADGDILSLHYRENQFSGILTLTTLPLLNFSLLMEEEYLKTFFDSLLINNSRRKNIAKGRDNNQFSKEIIYILLLSGAGISIKEDIDDKINEYFYQSVNVKDAEKYLEFLIEKGFINTNISITNKGMNFIKEKGYYPYLKEIQRKKRDNQW